MSDVSAKMNLGEEEPPLVLPPGFRFHPTDGELIADYLSRKALNRRFSCIVITEVDLNKTEPWDLPGKARMGEKEWYFFCHKDRKYPTGARTNRATPSGYWKATGKDKEIFRGRDLVGMRKTLVFYTGRAPRGGKTPWVMHEFRLEGKLPQNLPRAAKVNKKLRSPSYSYFNSSCCFQRVCCVQDEWAVCRVLNKDLAAKPGQMAPPAAAMDPTNTFDDIFGAEMPPPLIDYSPFAAAAGGSSSSYQVIKAEAEQPAPVQDPKYFSLPVAEQAIRAHCRPQAPAEAAAADSSYPELDDLLQLDDGFLDYSNMWNL
ncbi:unnamed protein product [Urochloa decumbens]|uniref:NAC domain-containing protein n=1 Tax=Urochloa decumbens TaxID=240449 RepID=A0ABC9EP39_9POAL